jgi:lysozyme family protein
MKGNFDASVTITLGYEGGYSDTRADPGNWTGGKIGKGELRGTKYGIAAASHPGVDIKGLTLSEAKAIYKAEYWRPIRGDDLPIGIDLSTFDYGVNSGPSRSVKALQAVIGAKQDGKVGPATIKAAILADTKDTIQRHCAKRLGFLRGLGTWKTFGGGWSKRVANVEAKAVAMWLSRGGALSGSDVKELQKEAGKADAAAKSQKTGAGGAVAGGGALGGGDAVATGEPNWLLIVGVAVAVIVVVTVLIARSKHNKNRAEAYAKVASSA